ncbi:MAG: hypothetical protein ABIR62_06915, partial [Dokdonella sp.]|uniref:hypothetical protein n=1 Tax=Dokdonella sp. TaxID=2291710 RepID=UPI003265B96A
MSERRLRLAAAAVLFLLITVVVFGVLKLPYSRVDVPYAFTGDAIDKLAQIQNVIDTGWLFDNLRLGYPFGYDRLDFPRFDSLNYLLMAPVALITGHPGTAMNLYFLLGFYLIGFAALFCFRQLGLRWGPALLCSVLYSVLPYHVLRNVGHLTNGAYFLVPFAALVLLWVARNRFDANDPGATRRWLLALVVCVLVPLQMPYNGVFLALLCPVAVALAIVTRPGWRTVLVALSLMAAVAGSFVVEQVPVLLHQASVGKNTLVADRSPEEAELYSMRLDQVVLPTQSHRLRSLAEMKRRFDDAVNVPQGEFRNQYIGAFGVFGLLALLWVLVRAAAAPERTRTLMPDQADEFVRAAAILALAAIFLAVSSGVGVLIAFAITSKVRTYNRILPFLAFFCLFGAGWALQAVLDRVRGNVLRVAILCAIGSVAVFDTVVRMPHGGRADAVANFDVIHAYFASVEQRLGNGATVLQLPASWYPEHPPINRMTDYEEFKPFLMTHTLRFSYGVSQGRPGYVANLALQNMPAKEQIRQAHALGFDAVLIDSQGYADDEARALITDALAKALPQEPSVSPGSRWWLFPLGNCCGAPVAHLDTAKSIPFAYDPNGEPIRFATDSTGWIYNDDHWSYPESWGTWSLGATSHV